MEDVLEVMQAEDLQSINLLGFSDGANIAMLLASKYPTRIHRLILNAGNSTYAGLYSLVRFTVKSLNICAHLLRRPSPALQLLLEDVLQNMDELENITAPTLVINGQFDVVKTAHAHDIAKHIPNSQFLLSLGEAI